MPCVSETSTYLKSNHVLSIDFNQMVVDKDTISCSRWVLNNRSDLIVFEYEAHVSGAVLLQGNGALKGPMINILCY